MPRKSETQKSLAPARVTIGLRAAPPKKTPRPSPREKANQLIVMGWRRIAELVKLGECLYLRPGELCRLTPKQLIPPCAAVQSPHWSVVLHPWEVGVPSKTGHYNESLPTDGANFSFLAEVVAVWKKTLPADLPIMPVNMDVYARLFRSAATAAQVSILEPVPYHLRHAGAAGDLLRKDRLDPAIAHHCSSCHLHFGAILARRLQPLRL